MSNNNSNTDKVFADGFSFKRNDNAPDFVVGRLSMKVDDAIAFLKENKNSDGWVNVDVKQARSGNYYCELDTYKKPAGNSKPQAPAKGKPQPQEDEEEDFEF